MPLDVRWILKISYVKRERDRDNNFINPPEGKFLCYNSPAAVENTIQLKYKVLIKTKIDAKLNA